MVIDNELIIWKKKLIRRRHFYQIETEINDI